jgi:hypothetical protein
MLFERGEGGVELAVIAAFVTAEEVGVAVGIAQRVKSEQGMGGRILLRVGSCLPPGLKDEASCFERPDAEEAPVCDRHFLNEEAFGVVLGLVFVVEGREEIAESAAGFVVGDDGGGEERFAARVAGILFALRRFGAGGFSGVCAVSREFAIRDWHTMKDYTGGVKGFEGYIVGFIGKFRCD